MSSNQMIAGSISSSGSRNSGSGYGSALVESDDRWFDCRQSPVTAVVATAALAQQ